MGRLHRHADGTVHEHAAEDHDGSHEHGSGPGVGGRDVGDHSGYETQTLRVEMLEAVLGENDRCAAANRAAFARAGVHVVNLMSAPGAGKTALLERSLPMLPAGVRVGIIEGDIATALDADRLLPLADAVSLLNTSNGFGGECHLDAAMVASALSRLPLADLDLVVVENVGNLVCPAEFAVGEHRRAMVVAVTEGEDKPAKYPVMFHAAECIVVNKLDLLPHLDVDLERLMGAIRDVNPDAQVLPLSARTGEGLEAWVQWLMAGLPEGIRGIA